MVSASTGEYGVACGGRGRGVEVMLNAVEISLKIADYVAIAYRKEVDVVCFLGAGSKKRSVWQRVAGKQVVVVCVRVGDV
jgi:hypothetical protein